MDRFGFTAFANGYLEKGARGVRGTLKQEEGENCFGQYSSLSEQSEISTSGDKQLFNRKNLARSSSVSQKHVGSDLLRLAWRLHSDSFTLTPLTEKT
jgi:hypothetical protein